MKGRLALLAFVLFAFAAGPACAQATLTLHFSRPELAVRAGAVQAVSARSGGLAPYVEVQGLTRLARTSFGIAAHAGLSYERHERTEPIICVAGFAPSIVGGCSPLEERASYLDVVTGVRAGFFPDQGPVDLFAGLAWHAVRESQRSENRGDADPRTDWSVYPTVQAGADVRLALTSRLEAGVGAVGFLPLQGVRDDFGEDMRRLGAHLSLRYDL